MGDTTASTKTTQGHIPRNDDERRNGRQAVEQESAASKRYRLGSARIEGKQDWFTRVKTWKSIDVKLFVHFPEALRPSLQRLMNVPDSHPVHSLFPHEGTVVQARNRGHVNKDRLTPSKSSTISAPAMPLSVSLGHIPLTCVKATGRELSIASTIHRPWSQMIRVPMLIMLPGRNMVKGWRYQSDV
jgi:hypothetical protein